MASGQWFPGAVANSPEIGPSETAFLTAYTSHTAARIDYPGVQAVAGAAAGRALCPAHRNHSARTTVGGGRRA